VPIPGLWWKLLTGVLFVGLILASFLYVGPARGFTMQGHGAKLIFVHVPCAWMTFLAYIVAGWYAARLLANLKRLGWAQCIHQDLQCAAAMELGFLFALLATLTGSIFSKNEWGAYWHWDPRQTSILIILLIFSAYLVLRGAVEDAERRARLTAVYALISVVPGTFLIWVLPRIVETMHSEANQAVVGGGLGGSYRLVLYGLSLPAFLLLFVWLFQIRVRSMNVERRLAGKIDSGF
jgi:heme exporter protein C